MSINISKELTCERLFTYLTSRQTFGNTKFSVLSCEQYTAVHLPKALSENELDFGELDKIFAAEWLDEYNIICGTKCNTLIVQNIVSKRKWEIPLLTGSNSISLPSKNCGIHTISINQSSTKLATGALNPSSVGFYKLPSLEPLCIGEFHTDWLFCSAWLNDETFVSGSRDKRIAFWSIVDDFDNDNDNNNSFSSYNSVKPIAEIGGHNTDKVRAMVFNQFQEQLATIASNGYLHIWDVNSCHQVVSSSLPYLKENVCIAHDKMNSLYAVGSLSHVSLLEKTGKTVSTLSSSDAGAGVRSVSFNGSVITIGTGFGSLLFYDVRMNKLLERDDGTTCQLKTGPGWIRRDSVYHEYFWESECYHAIYAHSYNPNTMKLLAAGGPLANGLYGNYAAYWD